VKKSVWSRITGAGKIYFSDISITSSIAEFSFTTMLEEFFFLHKSQSSCWKESHVKI